MYERKNSNEECFIIIKRPCRERREEHCNFPPEIRFENDDRFDNNSDWDNQNFDWDCNQNNHRPQRPCNCNCHNQNNNHCDKQKRRCCFFNFFRCC